MYLLKKGKKKTQFFSTKKIMQRIRMTVLHYFTFGKPL